MKKKNTPIETDDIIIWFMCDEPHGDRIRHNLSYVSIGCLAWAVVDFAVVILWSWAQWFMVLLYSLLCVWGTHTLWRLVVWSRKREQVIRTLMKKSDRVPIKVLQLAIRDSRNYWEGVLWAVECDEAHCPGDCPLCGAN